MKVHRYLGVSWLVAGLLLAACGPEAWERDPAVQAAKKACTRPDEIDRYTCVERHAVETLNPDVCRLAGIWIDDMCLQAVYEAAADPAICERLYLEGVRPTCRAYYSQSAALELRYRDPVLGFAVEARAAFETFLRSFSFIPITATPPVAAPTVTPVPTPSPLATSI